jgi:hypothetical protein
MVSASFRHGIKIVSSTESFIAKVSIANHGKARQQVRARLQTRDAKV